MENKKFELSNITMEYKGRTLYRIKATKDFSDVKKGDLGGWVQYEENLSQQGICWIYDDAKCMDNSRVTEDSIMRDFAEMYDCSKMHDYSQMFDHSEMHYCSEMYDYSQMHDYSKMCNFSEMYDCSEMHDYSQIHDYSQMHDFSEMHGNSMLKDKEKLYGKLYSIVDDFIEIHNKKGRIVTGVLKNGEILYNVGYQEEMAKEEFIDRIYYEDGGIEENPHRKEYIKIINMIESYFSYEE